MIKFIKIITEIAGWFQIVLFPLLTGIFIGTIVYYYIHNTWGLVLDITIVITGLVIGVIIATRIWKKKGTISFLSRIHSTPELDTKEKKND